MSSGLDLHINGRVAHLRFNRPAALNALTPDLLETLIDRCEQLNKDDTVHLVVLEGAGPCFSAGADLPAFQAAMRGPGAAPQAIADLGRRAAEAVAALPQISVAAVHAHCIGGGVVLAAACDLRLVSDDARFRIPEVLAGIPLGWGGLARLAALVGETAAIDLVLTARPFDADEAHRLGLVTRVVPASQRETLADEFVGDLAALTPYVLRMTKTQLGALRQGNFDARADAGALLNALADPDSQAQGSRYWKDKGKRAGTT